MPVLNPDVMALTNARLNMDAEEERAQLVVSNTGHPWAVDRLRLIDRDRFILWRHRDKGEREGEHVCRRCYTVNGEQAPWPCVEVRGVIKYWSEVTV